MFMNKFIIIISFLFSTIAFGDVEVGKVIVLKGNATALLPSKKEAVAVYEKMEIPVETSILTYEKSVIKIEFEDGSIVMLSPNSKMVLRSVRNQDRDIPTIITLLKGKIRAKVKKEQVLPSHEKFVIKTTAASFGVRGTEFEVLVSNDKSVSGVITYEGKVSMVKNQSEDIDDVVKNTKKSFQNDKSEVLITQGHFANIDSNYHKKLVKIDESQIEIMKNYDYTEFNEEKSNNEIEPNGNVIDLNNLNIINSKDHKIKINNHGEILNESLEKMKKNDSLTFNYGYSNETFTYLGTKHNFSHNILKLVYGHSLKNEDKLEGEVYLHGSNSLDGMENGPSKTSGVHLNNAFGLGLLYEKKFTLKKFNINIGGGFLYDPTYHIQNGFIVNKSQISPKLKIEILSKKTNKESLELSGGIEYKNNQLNPYASLSSYFYDDFRALIKASSFNKLNTKGVSGGELSLGVAFEY